MTTLNEPMTEPIYETAARDLLAQFGPDTLAIVDMAIAHLEEAGRDGDAALWSELRLALLRRTPAIMSGTLQ